jgi:hypothetical protein
MNTIKGGFAHSAGYFITFNNVRLTNVSSPITISIIPDAVNDIKPVGDIVINNVSECELSVDQNNKYEICLYVNKQLVYKNNHIFQYYVRAVYEKAELKETMIVDH